MAGKLHLTHTQEDHKSASTAYFGFFFILMIAYFGSRIFLAIKTKNGTQKAENLPLILEPIIRVIENDMAPGILYYAIAVTYGAFFGFMAFFGYAFVLIGILLAIAYAKMNYKLIKILRIVNVVVTSFAFFAMFFDNLTMNFGKKKEADLLL